MNFLTFTMASMPESVEPMLVPDPSNNDIIPLNLALANLGITIDQFNSFCQKQDCYPVHLLDDIPYIHRDTLALLVNLKTNRSTWD